MVVVVVVMVFVVVVVVERIATHLRFSHSFTGFSFMLGG
jgi:hypothetical protein